MPAQSEKDRKLRLSGQLSEDTESLQSVLPKKSESIKIKDLLGVLLLPGGEKLYVGLSDLTDSDGQPCLVATKDESCLTNPDEVKALKGDTAQAAYDTVNAQNIQVARLSGDFQSIFENIDSAVDGAEKELLIKFRYLPAITETDPNPEEKIISISWDDIWPSLLQNIENYEINMVDTHDKQVTYGLMINNLIILFPRDTHGLSSMGEAQKSLSTLMKVFQKRLGNDRYEEALRSVTREYTKDWEPRSAAEALMTIQALAIQEALKGELFSGLRYRIGMFLLKRNQFAIALGEQHRLATKASEAIIAPTQEYEDDRLTAIKSRLATPTEDVDETLLKLDLLDFRMGEDRGKFRRWSVTIAELINDITDPRELQNLRDYVGRLSADLALSKRPGHSDKLKKEDVQATFSQIINQLEQRLTEISPSRSTRFTEASSQIDRTGEKTLLAWIKLPDNEQELPTLSLINKQKLKSLIPTTLVNLQPTNSWQTEAVAWIGQEERKFINLLLDAMDAPLPFLLLELKSVLTLRTMWKQTLESKIKNFDAPLYYGAKSNMNTTLSEFSKRRVAPVTIAYATRLRKHIETDDALDESIMIHINALLTAYSSYQEIKFEIDLAEEKAMLTEAVMTLGSLHNKAKLLNKPSLAHFAKIRLRALQTVIRANQSDKIICRYRMSESIWKQTDPNYRLNLDQLIETILTQPTQRPHFTVRSYGD